MLCFTELGSSSTAFSHRRAGRSSASRPGAEKGNRASLHERTPAVPLLAYCPTSPQAHRDPVQAHSPCCPRPKGPRLTSAVLSRHPRHPRHGPLRSSPEACSAGKTPQLGPTVWWAAPRAGVPGLSSLHVCPSRRGPRPPDKSLPRPIQQAEQAAPPGGGKGPLGSPSPAQPPYTAPPSLPPHGSRCGFLAPLRPRSGPFSANILLPYISPRVSHIWHVAHLGNGPSRCGHVST